MKILRWLDRNLEECLMIVLLFLLTCIMMLQVILRYVFKSPMTWSEEFCRYCFVYSVMLATSYCVRRGTMLKVDVVVDLFPEKVSRLLNMLAQLIMLVFFIIMLAPSVRVVMSAFRVGNTSPAMGLPMWIVQVSAPLGFFLGIIRGVQVLVFSARDYVAFTKKNGEDRGE